jgi:hypothetical protein
MFWEKPKSMLSRQEALAVKPVRMVEPELKELPDGGAKMTVKIQPTRTGRWFFRLPMGSVKTFELDALGMLVWNSCDGKTSVQQIIRKLAREYNLNLREAEVPTVKFLQMLVKKGLIGMPLQGKKE